MVWIRRPRVVHADALKADWDELLAGHPHWHLVANLPYNVATPLVLDLLDSSSAIDRMLVMVQREVGERLAAGPGTSAYGIPSVKVAYWASAEIVGRVGPSVFLPRPKVESVLVRIVRRSRPATAADPDRMFTLVRAGFGQRRKMLRRSLAALVTTDDFARAEVAPETRAEELSVVEWGQARRGAANSVHPMEVLDASAKLTLSLRVTGTRPDGYHLLDAEMVTLDLVDTLTLRRRRRLGRRSARRARACRPTMPTSCAGRSTLIGRKAHVTIDKRIPPGARARRRLGRRRRGPPVGGRRRRRRSRCSSGPTSRSACSAVGPG